MTWLDRIEDELKGWLGSSDGLRAVSAELRGIMPIVRIGPRTFVLRYDDVRAALANDRDFGVTEIYAARMDRTTGTFFLGLENTPRYQREADIARRATKVDDGPRIAAIASNAADELLEWARARGGVFDGVNDYARLIPLRILDRYFGVPGPDIDTMKRWMRFIFWDIFLNPDDDPAVLEGSRQASAELRPYLEDLFADRKRKLAADDSDDFIARLLRQQAADPTIDDDLLRRNIGGIIVGGVDTISKCIAHVVDQLMRRPLALETARRAARADDDATVAAHVWEALRFNPHNPLIFRHCRADTVLAEGTSRRTAIEKGATVLAVTISAMFDGEAFPEPDEFRIDRPRDRYLHFGFGQHTCFGSRISGVVIPIAVKALLKLDNLAYDEGAPAKIEYEGPFPDRMRLRFDVPK